MEKNQDIPYEELLLNKNAYPEDVKSVNLIQTHISYIFLTDKYVYKIKKPVNFGFLDFSTLEKRRYYCEQEVKLNNRLSTGIYLGICPVVSDGNLLRIIGNKSESIEKKYEVVDWAVKMRKIPQDLIMKEIAKKRALTSDMISRIAKKIAEFHRIAETNEKIARFGEIDTVKTNTDENFEQTKNYIGKTISRSQYNRLRSYTERFYKTKAWLFKKRIEDGFIKDCHGDLHMEHICITDPIIIYDCIEFNERFRYSDTAADIAFLAMDLDYNHYQDMSELLVSKYIEYSGDDDLREILDFYKIYRAYVRGKVISFRLDDPHISEEDKETALNAAKSYFALASSYI